MHWTQVPTNIWSKFDKHRPHHVCRSGTNLDTTIGFPDLYRAQIFIYSQGKTLARVFNTFMPGFFEHTPAFAFHWVGAWFRVDSRCDTFIMPTSNIVSRKLGFDVGRHVLSNCGDEIMVDHMWVLPFFFFFLLWMERNNPNTIRSIFNH